MSYQANLDGFTGSPTELGLINFIQPSVQIIIIVGVPEQIGLNVDHFGPEFRNRN